MNSDILNSTPKDDPLGDKDTPKAARGNHPKENEAEDLAVLNGAQLLLVEDNEITQEVVREILERVDIIVTLANNGLEAFQLVKKNKYDAILMDIQMPVMDGYAATREIRKWESVSANADTDINRTKARDQMLEDPSSPDSFAAASRGEKKEDERLGRWEGEMKSNIQHPTYNTPIIAMTAHAMSGDEQKSIAAGMNDHVTKPIDPEQLFSTLQKWIKPVAERTAAPGGPPALDRPSETEKVEPQKDELPQSLPGFDLDAGLSRLMGNKRLYRKLLLDFGTNYGRVATEIRETLAAADFKQAHSLVHNLKGMAGNLAAGELQAAAGEMEKLVKGDQTQTPSKKQLDHQLMELENVINQALEAVQILGSPVEEKSIESTTKWKAEFPVEFVKEITDRIRASAEMGDVIQLKSIAEELMTESDGAKPFCDELVRLADDFDFDGINKLLL